MIYHLKRTINYIALLVTTLIGFIPAIIFYGRPGVQQYYGYIYARIICPLVELKVNVYGRENIPDGQVIYVLNHQSSLDTIPFSYLKLENTKMIAIKYVKYAPLFGQLLHLLGNFFVSQTEPRQGIKDMHKVENAVKNKGVSIGIFPEGGRNTGNDFLPFKAGAFKLAIKTQTPIVPIVISSFDTWLDKEKKIWTKGEINIHIMEKVETKGLDRRDLDELRDSIKQDMVTKYRQI